MQSTTAPQTWSFTSKDVLRILQLRYLDLFGLWGATQKHLETDYDFWAALSILNWVVWRWKIRNLLMMKNQPYRFVP